MGILLLRQRKAPKLSDSFFFSCSLRKEIASIPAGSYSLGRPWHPSADPNAVGMSVFINCWMDGMIKTIGWDSMSSTNAAGTKVWFVPYKTSDSRFYEYKSTGRRSYRRQSSIPKVFNGYRSRYLHDYKSPRRLGSRRCCSRGTSGRFDCGIAAARRN